jgi:CBS domain-containing protein
MWQRPCSAAGESRPSFRAEPGRKRAMKRRNQPTVEDFMSTAVITMKESDTLSAAQIEMRMAEIRHLPIVDPKGHVVGVLSDRDILRNLTKIEGKPTPVAQIMSRRVRTVRPGTPAAEAATLLLEHKFGCLPVVGDDEQIVGIITDTDFLKIAERALLGADVAHRHA